MMDLYEQCGLAAQRAREWTPEELDILDCDGDGCYDAARAVGQDEQEAALGWQQPGVCEWWDSGDSRVGW